MKDKIKIIKCILSIIVTALFVYITVSIIRTSTMGMAIKRIELIILLYLFIMLNILIQWERLYGFIFHYRVWITFILCAFMIINKFNSSSVNQFDQYVQPGCGSEYVEPVFGESRSIRSDEWMVSVPRIMSTKYAGLSKYNDIVRATEKTNISASGLYLSYAALATPEMWGYYLFGIEYGLSYFWSFRLIFGFLIAFEFCYILTKRKRILALFGAALINASSYNSWWSTDAWLIPGMASIVLLFYFFQEKSRKKRLVFGGLLAIFGADFVVGLYPAWEVPAGYVFLGLLIWLFIINFDVIKKYNKKDWFIFSACVVFMLSLIVSYLLNYVEYMTDMLDTVYPGNRVVYGGYSLNKLLGYIVMTFSPYIQLNNPSEMGCFFGVFPLGYLLFFILLVRKKGKALLLWCIGIPTCLLTLYCLTPLPSALAKISLLTFSFPERAVDIVGFALVIICLVVISELYESGFLHPLIGTFVSIGCIAPAFCYSIAYMTSEKRIFYFCGLTIFTILVIALIISRIDIEVKKSFIVILSLILIISGYSVNPIMYGLDAVNSKPIAKKITSIVEEEPEKKWIALDSLVTGNFAIACGARTYNSTNYIPNYEFWKKIDPSGDNQEIYDRYAHIVIHLADESTSMKLVQQDYIDLTLSFEDLEKLDVDYILSYNQYPALEKNWEKVYDESGMCIYKRI